MCAYVQTVSGFQPVASRSSVVFPKSAGASPFYIVCMPSEIIADEVRIRNWKSFRDIGCWIGEDLTPWETDQRKKIKSLMTQYWGIQPPAKIRNSRFIRDQIKVTLLSAPGRFTMLTLPEVQEYTAKRLIAPYETPNAGPSGR